ncbi:MAG: carbohydrate-binding protein, partial [bacterium]
MTRSPFCFPALCLTLLFTPALLKADPTWTLTWDDEFNGAAGSSPDASRWTYDLGGGGWGNGELETYTKAPANVELDGSGHLLITAVDNGGNYTSARIKTEGLFDQAYGYVEASIQIPWGVGVWPAFWMLGSNINTHSWPACGEIDLMENIGQYNANNVIGGHIHGPVEPGGADYNGGDGVGTNYTLPSGTFNGAYHLFAAAWSPTQIVFYVDGTAYQTITAASLPAGGTWVFNHPFFILLNLAVGGTAGSPSATSFPQQMSVDYVRVYKLTDNGTTPYGGTAATLPGTVQAENYDSYTDVSDPAEPGEGFAYNGLGPVNIPGAYRPSDAVSVEACSDTGGGHDVTDTSPGQWLQYGVNATQAGVYTLDARVASSGTGGTFHVDVDGNSVTPELNVPDTGGWQNWGDVLAGGITLSAGAHSVLLVEDSMGASTQGVCNFNYLNFALASPTTTPSVTPTSTPSDTPSATLTSTPSDTPSATLTFTPSDTPSATLTFTPSETPSPIPSGAVPSETPFLSATTSATQTQNPAGTDTSSPTDTPSYGITATQTTTATATPSATVSIAAGMSPTDSATTTPGSSPTTTLWASPTPSPSASSSVSVSSSPSASSSPIPSGTPTSAETATPSPRVDPTTSLSASPSTSTTPTACPTTTLTTGTTPASATASPTAGKDDRGSGSLSAWPVPDPNPSVLRLYSQENLD